MKLQSNKKFQALRLMPTVILPILAVLVFGGCFNPLNRGGGIVVTINVGADGAGRAVCFPEDANRYTAAHFNYAITFTNTATKQIITPATVVDGETVSASALIFPGTWKIDVEAKYSASAPDKIEGDTYALGTVTQNIQESQSVSVPMKRAVKVVFDSNGGSAVETQFVPDGEPITRPPNPVLTGFSFGNWYTDNNSFENLWNFSNPVSYSSSIEIPYILYARWIASSTQDGTAQYPFLVYNAATLEKVGSDTEGWGIDKNYKQVSDISLQAPYPGESNFTAIGDFDNRFSGSYDGGGFTISGLVINEEDADYQGLFCCIDSFGIVKNVGLLDCFITGYNCVGGIAGRNDGTIRNSYVSGIIRGQDDIGGIAGYSSGLFSTIEYCYSTAKIEGSVNIGGIIGENEGTVRRCYTTGDISGYAVIGGIAGYNGDSYCILQDCYSTGNISGYMTVGGVSGNSAVSMNNCYATGNVKGSSQEIGGVIGRHTGDMILNLVALNRSVSTASTSDTDFGRVTGRNNGYMNMNYSYGRSDMTVQFNIEGTPVDKTLNPGLDTVDGADVTPDQAITQNWWTTTASWDSLIHWDWANTWNYPSGNTLPTLKNMPGGTQDPRVLIGSSGGNTFEVSTPAELGYVGRGEANPAGYKDWTLDADYVLINNITLTGSWTPIGGGTDYWNDRGIPFTGSFDGNGKSISGLSINTDFTCYLGLFGHIAGDGVTTGVVKNLDLLSVTIPCDDYAGGVVGYIDGGTIENCTVTGTITGNSGTADAGGVAGYNDGGNIISCRTNVTITAVYRDIGGVVGYNNEGKVINCSAAGSIITPVTYEGVFEAGGVVGYNDGGIVQNCYSTGNIQGENDLGGVVGDNNGGGIVRNCYATGNITGNAGYIGGVVGWNISGGTVEYCYSTGAVHGDWSWCVGGVVGENRGAVKNCFATGNISSGDESIGGVVGSNDGGEVENCYATGNVSGSRFVGGVAGENNEGMVKNCYATGVITVSSSYVSDGTYAGSVAGKDYTATIQNCVGLSPEIIRLVGSEPEYGRVTAVDDEFTGTLIVQV